MSKKLLTITTLLLVVLLVGCMSNSVMATDTLKGATITNDTKSDSIQTGTPATSEPKSEIVGTEQTITITYNSASLKEVAKGEIEGRPEGFSWIGIKVTAPDNAKSCTEIGDGTKYTEKTFDQYFGVSEAKLKKAVENGDEYITYTKSYTWEYDGESSDVTKTTLVVNIKVSGIELYNKENKVVWDEATYEKESLTKKLNDLIAKVEENTQKTADLEKELKEVKALLKSQNATLEKLQESYDSLKELMDEKSASDNIATEEDASSEKDDTPKTGLNSYLAAVTGVLAVSSMALVAMKKRV